MSPAPVGTSARSDSGVARASGEVLKLVAIRRESLSSANLPDPSVRSSSPFCSRTDSASMPMLLPSGSFPATTPTHPPRSARSACRSGRTWGTGAGTSFGRAPPFFFPLETLGGSGTGGSSPATPAPGSNGISVFAAMTHTTAAPAARADWSAIDGPTNVARPSLTLNAACPKPASADPMLTSVCSASRCT